MATPKLDPNLNLGDFDLGNVNGIDLSAILDNKPSPVVQGDDGNMYYSNAYYTPSGWQTDPDFSTPVYYFNQPSELGDVRKIYFDVEDDGSVTTQGSWQTEATIKSFWDADEGMGYFKEANPNLTYDNWMSFVKESSALNAQGLNQYDNSEEYKALRESYGIVEGFQNDDGDLFRWNGTSFTKTYKTPQVDYAKEIIQGAVLAAATWGTANAAIGTSLKGFFTSQLGLSGAAASAATSSLVSAGIQGVLGEELTVEGVLGSALGAGLGTQFSQLGIFSELPAAATSAIASASASAIEQGIINGTVDLETVISSGALGGGLEIGNDLFSSLSGNQAFTFGGLIEEGSSTFEFFNGAIDPTSGLYTGGLIGDARGTFNQFVEQNITGGGWWESASEQYDTVEEFANGKVLATLYDGSEVYYDSMQDFIKAGFVEATGTSPFFDLFTSGVDKTLGSVVSVIPDSWFDTLEEWIRGNSKGGSHTTEGGTTVTVATTGPGSNNGGSGANFDCSTVSRVQTADATGEESCGPCIEGFQSDEFGKCVSAETVEVCPEGQVYNEVAGACVDEVFFTPGQPCNTSDGQQGIFDDEGGCYVPTTGNGENGGNGECGEGEQYNEETQKCETVTAGPPGSSNTGPCTGNEIRDAQGNCVDPIEVLCSGPRPEEYGFEQINWDKLCGGTPVTGDPNTGTPPPPSEGCPEGQTRNAQGECEANPVVPPVEPPPPPGSPCAQQNRVENEDGSCGACLPGYMIDPKGFDQCVPTGIPVTPPVTPPAPPPAPEPAGGGSVGGGGTGMFKPANVSMGYNRTPELAVQNKPFKDYAAELDEQVKRLLTQRNKDIV